MVVFVFFGIAIRDKEDVAVFDDAKVLATLLLRFFKLRELEGLRDVLDFDNNFELCEFVRAEEEEVEEEEPPAVFEEEVAAAVAEELEAAAT